MQNYADLSFPAILKNSENESIFVSSQVIIILDVIAENTDDMRPFRAKCTQFEKKWLTHFNNLHFYNYF